MSGNPAELPESVAAIGDQLDRDGEVAPAPELFADKAVFVAEQARLFTRPWLAVDHVSRLSEDDRYFAFETAMRSVVVTRESADRLHALHNSCLHAGYRVCDAEEGAGERLHCLYHDWEYALDGRLLYPALSTQRYDPARLRLKSYPVRVHGGLILVDLSARPADDTSVIGALPIWLDDAVVTGRARYNAAWNWKFVHAFLRAAPELLFDEPPQPSMTAFGPLSFFVADDVRAALLRVIPRTPEQTDIQIVGMAHPDAGGSAGGFAAVEAALHRAVEGAVSAPPRLDRDFFAWYWSLMA